MPARPSLHHHHHAHHHSHADHDHAPISNDAIMAMAGLGVKKVMDKDLTPQAIQVTARVCSVRPSLLLIRTFFLP
jgi:hypothetical protein